MMHLDSPIQYAAWGVSFVLLVLWHLTLRRLPATAVAAPDTLPLRDRLSFRFERIDYISLSIVGLMAGLMWLGHNDLFPVPPDSYYHLRVAQNMMDTGSFPFWNDWEFAPYGRPHLYPPVYHLVLVCAGWLYDGDLLSGFRAVQCFPLPFAHLCAWFLARWLFGPRHALIALLLAGSDVLLFIVGMMSTPAVLAAAFATLMIVLFLSGHVVWAAIAGALSFYTHASILPQTLLGLTLFCLWQRAYGRRMLTLLLLTSVLASPWCFWIWKWRNWFQHPIDLGAYGSFSGWTRPFIKISWLQLLNLGLCMISIRAIFKMNWRAPGNRLIFCCAACFLPMLFSYGGRYFAHTIHFWAILGAGLFYAWWQRPITLRRVLLLACLSLCPSASLVGFGTVVPPGPYPMVSAWCLPLAIAGGGAKLLKNGEAAGLIPYSDVVQAAEYIRSESSPDDVIIFSNPNERDLAISIGFFAHRRINLGAWEETQPPGDKLREISDYARDYQGKACYVCTGYDNTPRDTQRRQFGYLYVGIRK